MRKEHRPAKVFALVAIIGFTLFVCQQRAAAGEAPKIFAAYAGSESCRQCHQPEFELWSKSHHALAERLLRLDMDRPAFDPSRKTQHASQTSHARLQDGKFQILTLGFKTNVEPYQVGRVIGHEPVRQFLTASSRGRWQAHELSYDAKSNQWFDVYGDDDRQPGEWGHWTGGGMNWNSQCAECHNTRLQKNYDDATDSYHTTMAEMSVGCEACHGPLKAHNEWRRTHPKTTEADPTITPSNPIQVLDTCASCHARREDLTGNFQPGDSFPDHYSLEILDSAERWYPDGQVHDEDYEYTSFLSSKMHQDGVACSDCHNPHSMKTKLPGNDLCMRCHNGSFPKAPVISPTDHGHHDLAGKGGECIGCHMPVTVYMQRQPRHDHGFTIPDPLLTKEAGIPNACNRCHADQTTDWALEHTKEWYGAKMNRHTRERVQWLASAQRGEDSARDKLTGMLTGSTESPYWRAVAAGLLWHWANDPGAKAALLSGLQDTDPLVREKSARSLETVAGDKEINTALKTLLDDQMRSVRVEAAWALSATVDLSSRAGSELQHSLTLEADQPRGQFRAARLQLARQQPAAALAHLQKAITQDPFSPPLRYEIAQVLKQLGRYPEARQAATQTLQLQPDFKPAQELLQSLLGNQH